MHEWQQLAITGLHFILLGSCLRGPICVCQTTHLQLCLSALLSGAWICFNLQELQLQLKKAILEIIIFKGSAYYRCKVLGAVL